MYKCICVHACLCNLHMFILYIVCTYMWLRELPGRMPQNAPLPDMEKPLCWLILS